MYVSSKEIIPGLSTFTRLGFIRLCCLLRRSVDHDHSLDELLALFSGMDLIVTEGYKRGDKPKLEIFRSDMQDEPLCTGDEHLLALITDADVDVGVPCFATNDPRRVADFLIQRFNLTPTDIPQPEKANS